MKSFFISIVSLIVSLVSYAQQPQWGNWAQWGDQHDGTHVNPIIPSDYSDIDCIRVGEDYLV